MNIQRGDVLKARFPHAAGGKGKKRPVVLVQADAYNGRLRHAVVAQMTSNLAERNDPACLFIEAASAVGQAAGPHAGLTDFGLYALGHERKPSPGKDRPPSCRSHATTRRLPEGRPRFIVTGSEISPDPRPRTADSPNPRAAGGIRFLEPFSSRFLTGCRFFYFARIPPPPGHRRPGTLESAKKKCWDT